MVHKGEDDAHTCWPGDLDPSLCDSKAMILTSMGIWGFGIWVQAKNKTKQRQQRKNEAFLERRKTWGNNGSVRLHSPGRRVPIQVFGLPVLLPCLLTSGALFNSDRASAWEDSRTECSLSLLTDTFPCTRICKRFPPSMWIRQGCTH